MKLLENKVALVTGGSRGIGEAIVRMLAAQGAKVAFTYVSESSAAKSDELATELTQAGATVQALRSDAGDFAAAEKLIADVVKLWGRIDILVNNAGITRDALMLRMTEKHWDDVMHTNLKSVFNLTKHVLRPMLKQKSGSIINISSVVGVFGNAGQANYAASKAGIFGFTKSIAKEVGSRNIRCNAIAPGYIETEMTQVLDEKVKESFMKSIPLGRMGTGADVANACVYLGSDMSLYVSGQILSICGALNC
jgi:3-oxoacyl-[acyl-carrier protein] reductase